MAFQTFKILRVVRQCRLSYSYIRWASSAVTPMTNTMEVHKVKSAPKMTGFQTERDLVDLGDPDVFGNLSRKVVHSHIMEDEGDIKEEEFQTNKPLQSQKLTTRQYADLIKQYLKHKRLKEAMEVLENRMIKEDQVKPENYIYNILIGACADVGYTKKAFKLFNDMKKRGLKPTGDTYTCLLTACYKSPSIKDGLKRAHHLRELMKEKGIEPNLTNYNSMIKAFGKCGDITTAFKIVDEMKALKIKIRVHTFNHLLHACITDKDTGLRHALVVWRTMLKNKEKPNIYSFNLMLRCVKECNLGTKNEIEDLIGSLHSDLLIQSGINPQMIEDNPLAISSGHQEISHEIDNRNPNETFKQNSSNNKENLESKALTNQEHVLEFVNKPAVQTEERIVPNLLSKVPNLSGVLSLCEVSTPQEKFAVLGGQDDFLKEMAVYGVKPDIKTFTQMLAVIDDNQEAELKLMETMKSEEVKTDIEFYNMLIKKRCLRLDYSGAFEVMKYIEAENKLRKKKNPLKKKLILKPDIMTYGALSMACKTKEDCIKFLDEMKEKQLKVNIEILGTLLRQGTANCKFGHIKHVMNVVRQEKLVPNSIFLNHLEAFVEKCNNIIEQHENGENDTTEVFLYSYENFMDFYKKWLIDMNVEETLKPEHPWKQFEQLHPETVQREPIKIVQPKKFYKRSRKFVKYTPRA